MQSALIAILAFACVFGGVLFGRYIRRILPEAHLREDTRQVIGLSMGLIGTLTALLLAMLTSSAKNNFDFEGDQLRQAAVNFLMLDRLLADYGPEAGDIRQGLRHGLERRLELTWPTHGLNAPALESREADTALYRLIARVRQLTPQNDLQRDLKSQALQQVVELMKARWVVLEQSKAAMPLPFLVVVVCWLTLIFASFGLFAPRNGTATTVLLISSLSVAGSLFLILELDTPFTGLMKVSAAPLRFALAQLGH